MHAGDSCFKPFFQATLVTQKVIMWFQRQLVYALGICITFSRLLSIAVHVYYITQKKVLQNCFKIIIFDFYLKGSINVCSVQIVSRSPFYWKKIKILTKVVILIKKNRLKNYQCILTLFAIYCNLSYSFSFPKDLSIYLFFLKLNISEHNPIGKVS